ncbi:MAG: glycosyltransferase family 2 protein [Candidatus Sabulitectum sp.]|nr:glycosyltransferase family 2 protein [Candidatus Sabulitectum sp.]
MSEKLNLRPEASVAVVVPCYKVRDRVLSVVAGIGSGVDAIICVDDGCPEKSGEYIEKNCVDPRVTVLYNSENTGVGGALIRGYRKALELGCEVVVKVDGDGQMDPSLIPVFVKPLLEARADYTKGNRFTKPEDFSSMPGIRLFGNAALSLLSKPSTGYWRTLDPTNGFTAIHSSVLKLLPLDKIDNRYFFETDMLHHLRNVDACVLDIPMKAVYADEKSSLKWNKVLFEFFFKHARNTLSRLYFQYLIKDFGIATIQLVFGTLLTVFGTTMGIINWHRSIVTGVTASSGSVMLAALPVILGIQMLLSFLNYDISSVPRRSVSGKLNG